MKPLLKKIIFIFFTMLFFSSIVLTVAFFSFESEIRIYESSSGELVFEDLKGVEKELAATLLADNEEFVAIKEVEKLARKSSLRKQLQVQSDQLILLLRVVTVTEELNKTKRSYFSREEKNWSQGRGT